MLKNFIFIILFLFSCSPLVELHGTPNIKTKLDLITIDKTNSNDILILIGPPLYIETFNKNIWFYNEVNHKRNKFGSKDLIVNNILRLEFNDIGILKNMNYFDLNDLKKGDFDKDVTASFSKNNSLISNFMSGAKERSKNFGKTSEQ